MQFFALETVFRVVKFLSKGIEHNVTRPHFSFPIEFNKKNPFTGIDNVVKFRILLNVQCHVMSFCTAVVCDNSAE